MNPTKLKNRMNGKVQDLQSHVKAADLDLFDIVKSPFGGSTVWSERKRSGKGTDRHCSGLHHPQSLLGYA